MVGYLLCGRHRTTRFSLRLCSDRLLGTAACRVKCEGIAFGVGGVAAERAEALSYILCCCVFFVRSAKGARNAVGGAEHVGEGIRGARGYLVKGPPVAPPVAGTTLCAFSNLLQKLVQ